MPLLQCKEVNLNTGDVLSLRTYRCPVEEEDLCQRLIGHLHWMFNGEDFSLADALQGRYESTAINRVYLGFVGTALVGTAWTITSGVYPGIALLAEVSTGSNHRRLGIAHSLCTEAIHDFAEQGGQWMLLGSGNPKAQLLYARLGFTPYAGDVMVWKNNGTSDRAYWIGDGKAGIRAAVWGDLPRLAYLYTTPVPWVINHWGRQIFSSRYFHQTCCVSTVGPSWKIIADGGGCWLVAETENQALVGSVTISPGLSAPTCHTAVLDIVVHENHLNHASQLVESSLIEARERKFTLVNAFVESGNQYKQELLKTAGFEQVGTLPNALKLTDRFEDVNILSCSLSNRAGKRFTGGTVAEQRL